nr:MAG TPA: hypothetical protein [Caudoviricetes sp.]
MIHHLLCVTNFQFVFSNELTEIKSDYQIFNEILLLVSTQFLYVNGVFHLETLQNRRLVILLTRAKLFNNTCLFEFSLELF